MDKSTRDTRCIEVIRSLPQILPQADLLPHASYCFIVPFRALIPGKYQLQATFRYKEGQAVSLITKTEVDSTIKLGLSIGIMAIVYTLTRLNLNFSL